MKIWIVIVVFSTASLVGLHQSIAQDEAESGSSRQALTRDQVELNLQSFDYVWETVRDKYFDAMLGGLNWEEVRSELRPQVATADSMNEVRRILDDMVSRLGVSHFAIIPSEAYRDLQPQENPRGGEIGFDIRLIEGRPVVTSVRSDTDAAAAGVQPGWEIVQIEEDRIADRLPKLAAELKDHPHRRTILTGAVQSRLFGPIGESLSIVFLDGEDQEQPLSIKFVKPRGRSAQFGNLPEFHAWIEVRRLDGDVGYIAFNAFMDPTHVMARFNEAMESFGDANGLIIDVRGNGGGMGGMATGMLGWLVEGSQLHVGTLIFRDTELKMLVNGRPRPFSKPVVVLIDEMSVSAAEFFASGFSDLERGRLIGTRTAGAALGSSIEKLPNGDGFQYAAVNYVSQVTGEPIEGLGVMPHIEVKLTRDALLSGRDPVLERAMEWLQMQREN